jgi:adenylate cyclase
MRQTVESLDVYLSMDRRQALAQGVNIPDRLQGAALFADISGFTPLTELLVREFGSQRGAEELTNILNDIYDTLIAELHRYGGSVIGFSGDAITCWIDNDTGLRAVACALAMQERMARFSSIAISSNQTVSMAMKVGVATGAARRFVVGAPEHHYIDVLAGMTLDHLAQAEHHAERGQVVLAPTAVSSLGNQLRFAGWHHDPETGERFGVVHELVSPVEPSPWETASLGMVDTQQLRPWLLPPVYERLRAGRGEFLTELRPVVILFLRFAGIDYDDDDAAGSKLDAYIRSMQSVLANYEAYLLNLTIGDKGSYLYATFGAPIAHEDDAARAVSAALELRALPDTLDFITQIQIGISRGRILAGAYGGITRRTYGVLGDEVNLAARLMQAAEPGQILVSKNVRETAGVICTWQSLPAIKVKGKADPVPVCSPIKAQRRRAKRPSRSDYALPMVGREAELALIEQKLLLAKGGQGQIIGITGEAGMGKTRLATEVARVAADHGLTGYASECESYGMNTSYLVWRPIWRAFFEIDPAWEVAEQTSVLEEQLAGIDPALVPRLPLLGAVLNLSIPDNDLTRTFDAKLRKTSLEALLADCLRARAGRGPLFLLLEDCHWLDPLSHDLVEVIGRAVANLAVVLILVYRPPEVDRLQAPRVSELAHFSLIRLTEFTPQEAERLIALKLNQFAGPQSDVPHSLVERITARAQGNPFYIEELLNYLRDRSISPQDSLALERFDLPTSLHSLILSRLDQRTESQKITLRVASVIGRLFRAALLWGMYPELGDPERIKADLEALTRSDLTLPDTPEPELAYLFKHIVTQEVAYESLPYAMRARLHEQLARFMEQNYRESLEQYVDLLAYHYERSENEDKKREYLLKAGEAAQANYANEAAINYYQRALPLLSPAEQVPAMRKLGDVLQLVGQWDEADKLYRRTLKLAESLDDRSAQTWCKLEIGELFRKRGLYVEAEVCFKDARADFEELGDRAGVGQVLNYGGMLAGLQGDYETARTLFQESLTIRRELGDEYNIARLLNNLAVIAERESDYETARQLHEEGLAIRQRGGDKRAIAWSLSNLGVLLLAQGDYPAARTRLEEAVALQREVGDRWWIANALNNLGNVAQAQGNYTEARALYIESLTISREMGDGWAIAYLLEDIAKLAAQEGHPRRALCLSSAAATLRQTINAPLPPAEQDKLEQALAPVRQALGETAADLATAEGKAMAMEQAIDYALQPN